MNFDSTLTMISLTYICITCLSWILCLTVGLPLILAVYFSKSFRSSFFSWGYYRLAEPFFKTHLEVSRKKAFKILKDSLKDRTGPFEVLEIGVGHGPNLQFYPENCFLTVLDKNKGFEPYFLKTLKKYSHISYRRIVIQPAENMAGIDDESFDVVISTYLHCSTDDSNAVLQEVKRVLKPVSKIIFFYLNPLMPKDTSKKPS
ncbi:Methyltransferase-like protein 7B [Araneus ventricosus]|uniref:Methyltransferase-like protein 7B n=1 Tax=Araneus ventricosus TaxID=182803 RepID=A0A4Y2NTT2_ARAVE|nr:Methyltransferase-like protein 7B [Araneus ventricosus]GBN42477.1 Methyltransferase-like protein 7B [Araneus ventricosus]